jgi:glycosyltransferase involved in cell wall biosynthesis
MARVAVVSFRFGGHDGVSVEAAKWIRSLRQLGHSVVTVAGEGADIVIPGLSIDAPTGPERDDLDRALGDADVVIVENLLSLPLNPSALTTVADLLRGRAAILHHHDLPWEHERFAEWLHPVPDDPRWRHVAISRNAETELRRRGIEAAVIYSSFDVSPPPGARRETRRALGLADNDVLVLQPTRAIQRKNVPAALALARALSASYWITGPAEQGYGPALARLLAEAGTPARHGWPPGTDDRRIEDAYAACDLVVLPSSWEGFGNPAIEAALHRRPLAVGSYPVADELRSLGFEWLDVDDVDGVAAFLARPDPAVIEANRAVAARHFDIRRLPGRLEELLAGLLG